MQYPYYNYYPMIQPVQPQPQFNGLNGKIVESEEIARIQEIPIGSYGVFPKADGSAIYFKSYNNDGTTKMQTFIPVIEPVVETDPTTDILSNIQKSIKELSKKFDSYSKPNAIRAKKKEDDEDE